MYKQKTMAKGTVSHKKHCQVLFLETLITALESQILEQVM